MMREYEITFRGRHGGCMETAQLTVIATTPSHALDLFDLYSEGVKDIEILNVKFIKLINTCLIEKVGD